MNKLYPQFSIKGVVPLVTFVNDKRAIHQLEIIDRQVIISSVLRVKISIF